MFHAESKPFLAAGLWFCFGNAIGSVCVISEQDEIGGGCRNLKVGEKTHDVVVGNVSKRLSDVFLVDEGLREGVEARFRRVCVGSGGYACAWGRF
jgi:hypothetical protein